MNLDIRLDQQALALSPGLPAPLELYLLPEADCWQCSGSWGFLGIQEIKTARCLLRYFLFELQQSIRLDIKEQNEGLQSLLLIRGELEYRVKNLLQTSIREKEFILLDVKDSETSSFLNQKHCHLVNAYYQEHSYQDLAALLPSFAKDLEKASSSPFYFSFPSRPARFSVQDSIQALLLDRYASTLQRKHVELRLESSLFTLLAQSYISAEGEVLTQAEREEAAMIKEFILRDISRHYTIEELANHFLCSPSYAKRLFSKVYGMGIYQFLRQSRMHVAKELLLKGYSLKEVAIEVGIQPSSFTTEFKNFFGYTVTQLKQNPLLVPIREEF